VEDAEARVEQLEREVAELTRALEDPDLYTTSEGTAKSAVLGQQLEARKRELDQALEVWSAATEHAGA
jgi:hypothetical protein